MSSKYKVVVLASDFDSEGIEWVYQVEEQSRYWAEFRVREEWVKGILESVDEEAHIAELLSLKDTNYKAYEHEINRIFSDNGFRALGFRDEQVEVLGN